MIKIKSVGFVIFYCCCVNLQGQDRDWERIYPRTYPQVKDHSLLSVGCIYSPIPQYMIGSKAGYVLFASEEYDESLGWENFKLPIPFDVTAVTGSGNRWIVGGNNGQIAIHEPEVSSSSFYERFHDSTIGFYHQRIENWREWLTSNWNIKSIGATSQINCIAESSNTIIALQDDGVLIVSKNNGDSGIPVDLGITVADLEFFNGLFHAAGTDHEDNIILFRSGDGVHWAKVWELIDPMPYVGSVDCMLLSESYSANGHALESGNRLYVTVSGFGPGMQDLWSGQFSTGEGNIWTDHGSYYQNRGVGDHGPLRRREWNPLDLTPPYLNFPRPGGFSRTAGNVAISGGDEIHQYIFQDWISLEKTTPRQRFRPEHIAAWSDLGILYQNSSTEYQILSIDVSGLVHEYEQPVLGGNDYQLLDLEVFDGRFVVLKKSNLGRHLFETSDFINWTDISPSSQEAVYDMIGTGSDLFAIGNYGFWKYEDFWRDPQDFPNRTQDVVYSSARGTLVTYGEWEGIAHLENLYEDGTSSLIVEFQRDPGISKFKDLFCPDGALLVIVWEDARIFLVNMDNEVQELDLSGEFFESDPEISSVSYANGWYYLFGPTTLRTQDWITFDTLNSPDNEHLVHLTGFGDFLYAFSDGAIYRTPLKAGYLGSIEYNFTWHHADWLGWFQVIDEELGDIDHLLLGKCWVKQTSELEYWIRTETLGWIYMHKDWSPWFWRMENGHWYWLDHDSWPGRAWDKDDQEWEELRP